LSAAPHQQKGKVKAMQPVTPVRMLTRGEKVRIERIRRGWTQTDLARKCGLLVRTIGLLEQDKSKPTDKTLHKLSVTLDVAPEELI